jgi:streptogrisin C
MHRRTVGLATLGVATVGLVAAVTIPAGAASTPAPARVPNVGAAPAPASDEIFTALQRDLKLTPAQARTRLAREGGAARTDAKLRADLGPRFAGSWLDAKRGTLVVAVTDAKGAQMVRAAGAEAKVVTKGAGHLARTKDKLDTTGAKAAPTAVSGWYVDDSTNTVVVTARSAKAATAFAKKSGLSAKDVRVVESAEAPVPLFDIRGGDAMFMGGGRCSVGFAVTGGFVTAGHCGATGTAASGFNRVAVGTFAGSSFPGNDYAFVRNTNPNQWVSTATVNDGKGGSVVVAGGQEAPVGAAICRSGSTTGWHCGTVQAKNATVNYPQGQVGGLTRTNVCAEPGDSGGSWLSGDQAQGVTSGGSGDCTRGGTTFFQPLGEILSVFNLTLTTRGGNTTPPTVPPTTSPTPRPTATTRPPTTPPTTPPTGNAWQAGTAYSFGSIVTHNGIRYINRIPHRAQVGWEPPQTPALWIRL